MHLKRLELTGFKSFAKKSELEFNTSTTAIVGPNGSGKSNVAEAFRFVLGEQSVKSMRGKRTEDLIWNGSQMAPRANRASVKLTFDNSPQQNAEGITQRLLPIDFDTVTIERVIHRDSSSEYLVNGSVVRLRDIIELLSGAHIGASGHHIISQGEADRVLSVNVRERKVMIEDALGLKVYHYKKDESRRKLEKTRENIEKVESLRREIKPHLNFLGKQVAKLEKAQELAEALKAAYQEYFAREKRYLDETKSRLDDEVRPLKERSQVLEKQLTDAKETLSKLEGKDEKSDEVVAIEEKLKAVEDKKNACVLALGRIEGEIDAVKRQREREEKKASEQKNATVSVSLIQPHIDELERALEAGNDASALATLVATARRILGAIRTALSSGDNSDHAAALRELDDTQSLLNSRKGEHEQEKAAIDTEERDLRARYTQIQKSIQEDQTSSRDAERSVFAFSNELATVRMSLERLYGHLESLRLEDEEYKRDLGEAGALIGREALSFASSDSSFVAEATRDAQHDRKKSIERMKIRLEDAGIAGADELMKEYKETQERDAFLEREVLDLQTSAASLESLIVDLETKLFEEFTTGLGKINTQFSEFFSLMFGGGSAGLKLIKEPVRKRSSFAEATEDGLALSEMEEGSPSEVLTQEGVEIDINLPRKKVKSLEMLSGGERALTSIALIFAMSQVNPPPFIILDETDAALDEANSKRYGDMIESLAQRTQLIVITHNRETMSRAGVLYGVTMGRDAVSQLLSVSFTEAVEVAK
jgi:chromosome segregation protein